MELVEMPSCHVSAGGWQRNDVGAIVTVDQSHCHWPWHPKRDRNGETLTNSTCTVLHGTCVAQRHVESEPPFRKARTPKQKGTHG